MGSSSLAGFDRSLHSGDPYGLIGKRVSRYRILERIGGGGMGVVYAAEDARLERQAAIKFLAPGTHQDEAARRRFLHEAQTASALDHPNICTIYEAGETDTGLLYIAMAYYVGQTLAELISKGPLSVQEAVDILAQVGRGLKKAHDRGIIHRDIKPANIIITEDGIAKILDFGLAKVADLQLTRSGTALGTIAYMSPEQIRGGDADARADVWAMGVLLYEMLTGIRPFRGEYEAAILYSIVNETPRPLQERRSDIPPLLVRIVERAIAKDLAARYQTVDELLDDLRNAAGRVDTVTTTVAATGAHDYKPPAASGTGLSSSLSSAERRHVTMLFVDFAPAGEESDPEFLMEVMPSYEDACRKVAQRFEGARVPYPGEGMLVCFGYPVAHEDDARRAVRAGLAAVEACERLNGRLACERGIRVAIRAAVHTGLVVAEGRSDSGSIKLVGKTIDQAARLTAAAEPGTVVASEATFRLVEGFFDGRKAGAGTTYLIAHESAARNRLEAATGALTPLVGREPEIGMLLGAWEQAKDGNGQVVLLRGEAGIGKSRLLQVLKEKVARDPVVWLTETQCSPHHQNSPFFPVIEVLERVVLEFSADDGLNEKLDKIEGFLVQYGLDVGETAPLLADLLSLSQGDRYDPPSISPERQKQKTIGTLASIVLRRAAEQPMVFVVEDVHWSDPSTTELLGLIIDQCPTVNLFVVLTHRPDFVPPWSARSHLTQIALNRLTKSQVADMVTRVAGGRKLPSGVVERIVEKADGVPLYVEEITRTLLESGSLRQQNGRYELTGSIVELSVPSTLQDSLAARLDRLGPPRTTAQLGAVIGREFSYELIRVLSPHDEPALRAELAALVDAEMVYQRGIPPASTYVFRHALIQDSAYDSLLKSTRRGYHEQIGNVLVAHYPEIAESRPELIAHHFTEAGRTHGAIEWWSKAGRRAAQRSSNAEAVAHLTRALELLDPLPDSPEKIQTELGLQITLGPALMAVRGYASDDVERAYSRAHALCRQIGETPEIVAVLFGLWAFYVVRGQLGTARELAEHILRLTEQIPDTGVRLEAHVGLGVTLYFLGEFEGAQEHLEQAVALYDPEEHASHAASFGQDPGMASRIYLAKTLWLMGRADLADHYRREALEIAERLRHSHTSAFCLAYAALVAQYEGDAAATMNYANRAIGLAERHGFPIWGALCAVLRGWARAEQGDPAAGLEEIDRGIEAWKATGSGLYTPYWLGLRGNVLRQAGRLEEAKEALDAGLNQERDGEERVVLAELYRLNALLATESNVGLAKAEKYLQQAITTASHQSAMAWRLRATIALTRIHRIEDATADGDLLAGLLTHFPEGLETTDLREAYQLLG